MLTSVAYMPGRAPETQQQFVSVCLPHTIFTLYKKISACAAKGPSCSRNGCSGSSPERVCFVTISTSMRCSQCEYSMLFNQVCGLAHTATKETSRLGAVGGRRIIKSKSSKSRSRKRIDDETFEMRPFLDRLGDHRVFPAFNR